jgi:hypothetical protein
VLVKTMGDVEARTWVALFRMPVPLS